MARGRKPREGGAITKHVYLPQSLVAMVELALPMDPIRGVPQQGTWSHLVEALLREWLEKRTQDKEKGTVCQLVQ
jgi:hypothetical protein